MHWDPSAHTITYSNAGHCRPLLVTADGPVVAEHSDLILGLDADASFSDVELDLPPGAALVAYTDGLLELPAAEGNDENMLGEEGVQAAVADAYGSEAPIDALRQAALARSSVDTFQDDTLVLWLQREA
jgi:serine phosphatase RsbU (regulator of sigma subunit)